MLWVLQNKDTNKIFLIGLRRSGQSREIISIYHNTIRYSRFRLGWCNTTIFTNVPHTLCWIRISDFGKISAREVDKSNSYSLIHYRRLPYHRGQYIAENHWIGRNRDQTIPEKRRRKRNELLVTKWIFVFNLEIYRGVLLYTRNVSFIIIRSMIPVLFLIVALDQPVAVVRTYFLVFSSADARHLVLHLHAIGPFWTNSLCLINVINCWGNSADYLSFRCFKQT